MPRPASSRKASRRASGRRLRQEDGEKICGRRRRPRPPGRRRQRAAPPPRNRRHAKPAAETDAGLRTILHAGAARRESAAAASRGKYVYCIIESRDPLRFGPIGIGADPSDVYTVHYRNLAAVVSDAPLEVLDSTRENVLAHERVNETVMREHTVIPMSFGTIFKTREDIVELLRSAAEAFGDVLNKMQNKLEFGLKVLWDRDQAVREVEREDEDISRLKKEISGQKGPTYFARMQYGRLIDSALQSRSERYVADILDQLRDVSVASRINKPIGDKMIMNAAFLIARDQETAFDAQGQVDRQPLRQADVQVHRPVAAVQLRQHQAEARKSLVRLQEWMRIAARTKSSFPSNLQSCNHRSHVHPRFPADRQPALRARQGRRGGRGRGAGRHGAARSAARSADAASSSARSPTRSSPRSSATSWRGSARSKGAAAGRPHDVAGRQDHWRRRRELTRRSESQS